ncbi:MAG: ribonuclease HI family protein [Candidatus Micrarchaeia archaeon]
MSGESARNLIIYTDGASRGNPGKSASGFIVIENGKIICKMAHYNGIATNNFAEYNAIIKALEWCIANINDHENASLKIVSDSQVVVRQINGLYKVKSENLTKLHQKVMALAAKFREVRFENVGRENKFVSFVDRMVNKLLNNIDAQMKKRKY